MISKLKITILALAALLAGGGCNNQPSTAMGGGGREGEVVVVLAAEYQKGAAGQALDRHLRDSYLLLPQDEPRFRPYVIAPESYTNAFRGFRNIVKADIDPAHQRPAAKMQAVKGQTLITLQAPDPQAMADLVDRHAAQIVEALEQSERAWAALHARRDLDRAAMERVARNHGIDMPVPSGYQIVEDEPGFLSMRLDTEQLTLGLLAYYTPYTDTAQFGAPEVLRRRDSTLRRHVHGPLFPGRDSHMATTYDPVAPLARPLDLDGDYALELRGLWHMTQDFMAGPFISLTRLDAPRRRLVTIEGYVYYPSKDKRKFVRRFDALLREARFTPPADTAATQRNATQKTTSK